MVTYTYPLIIGEDEVLSERHHLSKVESGLMMMQADSVRWIVIHCTATRSDRDYTEEQLLRDHRRRGFRTVGYHFYIRRSGIVTQHRRLLEVGAHCRPYNRCSIGICYEGGLSADGKPKDTRTKEQRDQLQQLLVKLHRLFPAALVRGHSQMPGATPKACPCFNASAEYQWIQSM